MNIESLLKEQKGTVVDVRTTEEFQGGHVVGSINVPLQDVGAKMEELKSMNSPLILCCASGGRSGMATQMLQNAGVECTNGGSWLDVNALTPR